MTILTRSLLAASLLAGCALRSPRFSALDDRLRDAARRDEFSGVVLVAHAGTPELLHAYGRVGLETCFNLASASKLFTIVGIAQLAHAGKLKLDEPVATYLPDYPDPAFRAHATVRQLLTHTSGLPARVGPDFFAAVDRAPDLEALIAAVAVPAEAAPDGMVRYSNLGYLLLGRIIELASGEPYDRYVDTHILAVAGMRSTGPSTPDRAGRCATPMTRGPGDVAPSAPRRPFAPPRGTPAGSWYSTAQDLLRFFEALREGRLVAADVWSIALPVRSWGANRIAGHNGGGPGMNAELWLYPDLDETVVVLSNYDPPAATAVAEDIAELLTGTRPPERKPPRSAPPATAR